MNINTTDPPKMFPIRDELTRVVSASSIQINDLVYQKQRRGIDVITLSLGEAFFQYPFPSISQDDFHRGMHYSDSRGTPELREKLANYYNNQYGSRINPETEIVISAGSKILIFMAMFVGSQRGQEIIIHEPGWLSYHEQALLAGLNPTYAPYDANIDELCQMISKNTAMIILNNPNNPAGRLYSHTEIAAVYHYCSQRNVYLLLDESYSDFAPKPDFASLATIAPDLDGALIINSLSKNLGLSGWRIGYLLAAEDFLAQVLKLNQHLITCAPTMLANYCAKHFDEMIVHTRTQINQIKSKRTRVTAMLNDMQLKVLPGSTTFYFFVSIGEFPGTDVDFAKILLDQDNISVVPGSSYGASTGRFVRISFGTESDERIKIALTAIARRTSAN